MWFWSYLSPGAARIATFKGGEDSVFQTGRGTFTGRTRLCFLGSPTGRRAVLPPPSSGPRGQNQMFTRYARLRQDPTPASPRDHRSGRSSPGTK